jgi:hypothetical protein
VSRPVAFTLRLYRAVARAFPHDFQNAYGDEMLRVTEDAIEPIWRRYGLAGLLRLLLDIALRLPVEYGAEFGRDVRYGLRSLASAPGFTTVALVSLTLGIGVATSAFSEVNGYVLRDVPAVERPDELVTLGAPTSYPHYQRYRAQAGVFATSAAYLAPVAWRVPAGPGWTHWAAASSWATTRWRVLAWWAAPEGARRGFGARRAWSRWLEWSGTFATA